MGDYLLHDDDHGIDKHLASEEIVEQIEPYLKSEQGKKGKKSNVPHRRDYYSVEEFVEEQKGKRR